MTQIRLLSRDQMLVSERLTPVGPSCSSSLLGCLMYEATRKVMTTMNMSVWAW